MRKASVSIASNIAEGTARASGKEFVQFLYISWGSASELDTQIEIAKEVGLDNLSELETLQKKVNSISRMLQGLIRFIRNRKTNPSYRSPITSQPPRGSNEDN